MMDVILSFGLSCYYAAVAADGVVASITETIVETTAACGLSFFYSAAADGEMVAVASAASHFKTESAFCRLCFKNKKERNSRSFFIFFFLLFALFFAF